jgi:hypothetical protein
MDAWDASLGNSDRTWDCLEAIARRGGFKGSRASLMEISAGKDARDVTNRPWRWWAEACRTATQLGQDVLAGRIFLFTHLFATQIINGMRAVDQMETGLGAPPPDSYLAIAKNAQLSLSRLEPGMLIHNTATGKVDVAAAAGMAASVSAAS